LVVHKGGEIAGDYIYEDIITFPGYEEKKGGLLTTTKKNKTGSREQGSNPGLLG
jgi:hypothetical protein